jgi:Uma2 family endonuclease
MGRMHAVRPIVGGMNMAVQKQFYTAEALIQLPHDANRYALVKGHLIEMSPTGKAHGRLTARLGTILDIFVTNHKLGAVYGAETGFKLTSNPDTVYGIDVAFVSSARNQDGEGFFEGAPDLAIEVVSSGSTKSELHEKIEDLFRAGTRLFWVIYPKSRTIYVYDAPDRIVVLRDRTQTLSGGDVLPNFSVALTDIFSVLDKQ